jgi:PAS domain S-box-containing protein
MDRPGYDTSSNPADRPRPARLAGWLATAGLSAAACAAQWALFRWQPSTPPFVLTTPAIVLCGWLGGWWAGLLSTLTVAAFSAAFADHPGGHSPVAVFAAVAGCGALISLLCGAFHRERRHAVAQANRLEREVADRKATEASLSADVEQRRKVEDALRESELRLRMALVSAKMVAWEWDAATDQLIHSDTAEALLGIPGGHAPGGTGWALIHPADLPAHKAAVDRAVHQRESYVSNFRVTRPDTGATVYVEDHGSVIFNEHGAVKRMYGVMFDVTDRRRGERHAGLLADLGDEMRAGRDADELMEAVTRMLAERLDLARAVFSEVDLVAGVIRSRIQHCRGVAETPLTFAVEPADAAHASLIRGESVAVSDAAHAVASPARRQRLAETHVAAFVAVPLMRDGRWVAALGLHSAKPRAWTADEIELARIVADRTWLAVENTRLLQEARAANAAKDEFLAVLSHELRTPLTPVLSGVSLLQQREDLSDDVRDDLAVIRRNAELEARIIDDLLDVNRVARGKLQLSIRRVDVHDLLNNVVRMCQVELTEKRQLLTLSMQADPCEIPGDPARLQQVFWNLLKNAVKFTPSEGWISVITTVSDDGEKLAVTFTDNGVGIDPESIPRLFNAFEQGQANTARLFGGLGLGLSISKSITDLHGGALRAASGGRGRGSTFVVELPTRFAGALDEADAPPPPAPRVAEPPRRDRDGRVGRAAHRPNAGRRILLVEDHDDTRMLMTRFLGGLGHRVSAADCVARALEVAAADSFDLVVSDIGLPDGSGIELMRQLRTLHGLSGIALTGYGMEQDVEATRRAGFAEHLTKPVDIAALESAIERVSAGVDAARSPQSAEA